MTTPLLLAQDSEDVPDLTIDDFDFSPVRDKPGDAALYSQMVDEMNWLLGLLLWVGIAVTACAAVAAAGALAWQRQQGPEAGSDDASAWIIRCCVLAVVLGSVTSIVAFIYRGTM